MVKIFKILLNESTMYKYIQMPQGGKVLSYYDLGGSKFVNAEEWNINLNNEQELREFAEKQESLLN
jgi:hypothetical protein